MNSDTGNRADNAAPAITWLQAETDPAAGAGGNRDRVADLVERRSNDYDHPKANFTRIAGMWAHLFGWDVTPEEVGLAMICVKLTREWWDHKEDNLADIEGYAECVRRIHGGG